MRLRSFLLLCGFFVCLPRASALEIVAPTSAPQGSTIALEVSGDSWLRVEGEKGGKGFAFYPMQKSPADATTMTRGEFVQLLLDVGATTAPDAAPFFSDVSGESSIFAAVQAAKQRGLVDGFGDGTFRPHLPVTRAQAAKILLPLLPSREESFAPQAFHDLNPRHPLAKALAQAQRSGLLRGYPDGSMRPDRALQWREGEILVQRATGLDVLPSRPLHRVFRALVGFHRIKEAGFIPLHVTAWDAQGAVSMQTVNVLVSANQYRTDAFSLPGNKTALFENKAYTQTWEMIDGAKATTQPTPLWEGAFIVPTEGEISLGFGDKLFINGSYAGSHFGIDYANATGTPVYASNTGLVTLAAYTPSYGNTVIVDHGHHVFTMYMHLDSLKTEKGAMLQKGDLLGTIGATGIATGPHLHFTHFIGDVIVNSDQWFRGEF